MNKLNGLCNVGIGSGSTDKPYRAVPSNAYAFGFDEKSESKTRLIVKEQNMQQVREYELEDGINYICCGCFTKNKTKNHAYFDEDGFLMVPERHVCSAISVEASNQDQKRKRAVYIEAVKLKKNTKVVLPQSPPALPDLAPLDVSKLIPFVDLTKTDSSESVTIVGEVYHGTQAGRSNASSPEYVPESSPSNSLPPSPMIKNEASTKSPRAHETEAPAKDISGSKDDHGSSQSFNVTETSSDHTQSLPSPSGNNGNENPAQNRKVSATIASLELANTPQGVVKTDRSEDKGFAGKSSEAVIPLDDTVDDDSNVLLAAEENDDFIPIESIDYQYGYSANGIPNSRLIVFDTPGTRDVVRQYSKISNRKQWYCMGCYRAKRKHNKAYFAGESFMVPKKHFCQKFRYAEAKDMQKDIIQKLGLPQNNDMNNRSAERVRSRTVGPTLNRRSHETSVSDKRRARTPFQLAITSRRNSLNNQKKIKADTSEFDDGYHDYSPNSSSPMDEETGDVGDDEDYHPSNETERIPTQDFEYAYSAKKGNKNGRLIVFEPNDKTRVRQYAWNNCNFYFCIECYRLKKKKFGGKIDGSTFMAPKIHFCKPVLYEDAKQQQSEIVEKFGLNGPSSSNTGEIRISKRLQDKRESQAFGNADEGDEYSGDEFDDDESVEPLPYHLTPTDNRRRVVNATDFVYGVGNANQENFKIIVFENDRNFVREYGRKSPRQWYCCACLRLRHSNYATLNEQTFNAPIHHICKAVTYESIKEKQRRIKDRYRKRAPLDDSISATSPGMSLSNVAPVKPGSSISPPTRRSRTSKTEMEKRYDDENRRNMIVRNPPIRNMMFDRPSRNSLHSLSPGRSFNTSGEFREIDPTNYYYGFNERGEMRKRLIVYERNRSFVREYCQKGNDIWGCLSCSNGYARKENEKFFVTIRHNCIPIAASASKDLQSQYKGTSESSPRDDRVSLSSTNGKSSTDFSKISSSNDQDKSLTSTIPPSYRKVHHNHWQYGYDSYGNPNKRIIVQDADNLENGHEYRNDRNDTRCLGCAKNGKVAAKLIDGDLYVPPSREHTCEPRIYSEIQRLQSEYSKNMGRKRGRTVYAGEPKRSRTEKCNETSRDEDELEDSYMDSSKHVKPESIAENLLVNEEAINFSRLSSSNPSTTVSIYSPSAFFLSNCCKKLNIKYSHEAYQFWSKIIVDRVTNSSRPSKVYETKEAMYQGFSSFSLYFTGSESNTPIVREMINRYIYNNFKSLGKFMGHDFSQYTHETPVIRDALWSFALTDIHLECISRWFNCRIGIFGDKKWKRYGNWNDEDSDLPTFLMEIKNGKYYPILALA